MTPDLQLPGFDDCFTSENRSGLAMGFYPSMPQGHGLLCDENRRMVVADLGGCVQVAGITVTDPDALKALGEHLLMLAARLASRS